MRECTSQADEMACHGMVLHDRTPPDWSPGTSGVPRLGQTPAHTALASGIGALDARCVGLGRAWAGLCPALGCALADLDTIVGEAPKHLAVQ